MSAGPGHTGAGKHCAVTAPASWIIAERLGLGVKPTTLDNLIIISSSFHHLSHTIEH
jgi:predicted class III extradiol MEMO1 family dioxygenase